MSITHYECQPLNSNHLNEILSIEQSAQLNPWPLSMMQACFRNSSHQGFGVFCQGQKLLQAFAWISVIAPEAELLTIAVSPKVQRQGLGRLLLTHILVRLKQQDIQQIFLEVRASNTAAQALYTSLGFTQFAQRAHYYSATPKTPQEEAVCMRLCLCSF